MEAIGQILSRAPEVALFLSIGIGYLIGRVRFGSFSLGTTAGSLIVGIGIGIAFPGVTVDPLIKAVFFALFIYAVGFKTGPQFFRSFNPSMLKQVALAVIITVTGLISVIVCAKIMKLDEGSAAGLAAGGLTQSAIIGTAGDAISRLGYDADKTKELQNNVAIGYAVTYVFGTIGVIFFARDIAPRILKVDLRKGSEALEAEMSGGHAPLKAGEFRIPVTRTVRGFTVGEGASGKSVGEIESALGGRCTVINRVSGGAESSVAATDPVTSGDVLIVAGSSSALLKAPEVVGPEADISDLDLVGLAAEVVVTHPEAAGKTLGDLDTDQARGVYLRSVERGGTPIPFSPGLKLNRGDTLTLVGKREDVQRIAETIGPLQTPSVATDLFYCGLGMALGTLVGLISVRIAGIPVTLGAGGGVLLAGLTFGYLRSTRPTFGNFPGAVQAVFSDLGLAGFVAAIGLSAGPQAWDALKTSGLGLLVAGLVVMIVPQIVGLAAGMLMKMQPIVLIGAITGGRSCNAAIGAVTDEARSMAPALGFTVPYALANVLLTVWGPIVVGVMHAGIAAGAAAP
jgi:putative transport protein